ncbi:MAG: ferrous iron transport protein A [candidate division Zixibacteria bacterium]|nr:ferrous iron transport protein A [candidate division Zixibacteria bacterium]
MGKIDLTQLKEGESGLVMEIQGGYGLHRRLESLGIRVGKRVTKVSSQLMRGPVTLRVDNSQIALGYGLAKKIIVKIQET